MKKNIILMLSLCGYSTFAQVDTTKPSINFSGYIETYYSYDLGQPANHTRPGYMYSFNRHNEVNLNLGFLKAVYEKGNVKANLAFMTGTYSNANLASESGVLKNIFEANMSVKLSKTKKIVLEAGILPSHIGFESAVGKDCWNLTRSILADNTPYYESGAKVSYTSKNDKWFLSGLILNGWQRMQRVNGNNTPAFGHQITFKPNSKITLNSSSFIGSDVPDSNRMMRYFHNFYGQFLLTNKLGFTAGFDSGMQQKSKGSSSYNIWYSPVIIARYSPTSKINIAARGEYYSDKNQVIISTGTLNGFQTYGYSVNVDYKLAENAVWRIEGRGFSSKDKIFTSGNKMENSNFCITTALAISF